MISKEIFQQIRQSSRCWKRSCAIQNHESIDAVESRDSSLARKIDASKGLQVKGGRTKQFQLGDVVKSPNFTKAKLLKLAIQSKCGKRSVLTI